MSERPTPETDAKVSFRVDVPSCVTVPVDLARKLERERDEARNECKALWVMVDSEKKKAYTAQRERDEAREAATEQFIAAGKTARERDEAREEAEHWQELYRTVSTY